MMTTSYDKARSCAFTGHRDMDGKKIATVRTRLREEIEQCVADGVTNFVCGMALGFDMMAAEVVLELREDNPDITLVAAIPFRGQEDRWRSTEVNRYNTILDEADEVIYVTPHFERGCEMKRNRFMLDNACRVIAYFNGEPHGGTFFTYHTAMERGYKVVNLF